MREIALPFLWICTLSAMAAPCAAVLDEACVPLIMASEAKIAQPAWHAISRMDDFKSEVIKVDGKFFMKTMDEWIDAPMNLDDLERKTIASMQSGEIKVTDCQNTGIETIDGVETSVLTYSVELPGSGIPPAQTRINIGVADNLPYKLGSAAGQTSQSTEYRYTGVRAPL